MKRNLVLLAVFLISTAVTGAAQSVVFGVSGQSRPVRKEGLKELVGTATLTTQAGGTIAKGSTITLTFNTTIANASSVTGTNVLCSPAGCAAAITVTAAGALLNINFTASVPFTLGDQIATQGLRANANAVGGGNNLTATGSATVPAGSPFITFSGNPAVVAQVEAVTAVTVAYGTASPTNYLPGPPPVPWPFTNVGFASSALSILTCVPPSAAPPAISYTLNITENFPSALTSLVDEEAAPNSPAATNGSDIVVSFSNVPKDVTITPAAPIACTHVGVTGPAPGTCGLVFGATPAAATSPAAASTLTFTYTLTATNTGVIEDADLNFNISTTDATLPPLQATPSVSTVSLGDTVSTDTPEFTGTEAAPTAINISDCITDLLLPWVTNFNAAGTTASNAHYDTGIAIANTTMDLFTSGSAVPESGTCSLTMFPNDGSASVTYVSPAVAAGTSLVFTASAAFPGKQGYVIGTCNFQNAHAFVYVVDNAGLGPAKTATSYLGLIVPNTSLTSRNPAGPGGSGEALNN